LPFLIQTNRRPDISIKIDTTKELITDPSIHASSPTKSASGRDGLVSDDNSDFDVEVRHRGRGQPNLDVKASNVSRFCCLKVVSNNLIAKLVGSSTPRHVSAAVIRSLPTLGYGYI
jgi:hypothetical protein